MMKTNKLLLLALATTMMACSEDTAEVPDYGQEGQANEVFSKAEWLPGGELGTTTTEEGCYANPAPVVEGNSLLFASFNRGETFFEKDFTINQSPRKGLGPAYVRSGCLYCHPSYGHGKRQTRYRANDMGNGYLLVIYHPEEDYTSDGVRFTTSKSSYISEVTGMPQTKATYPFLPPIEEEMINIDWKSVKSMPSGLPMQFADGEKYELIYPEVTIPTVAFNTNPRPTNYEVRLESTIGIYGTGLLDAIDESDMKAQYASEASHGVKLNPGMWDAAANDWASSAWYTLADGTKRIKKFTYAMTRASLQDGAGANAMWNITNVTRSDRHYLYTTKAWAKAMSENKDVIAAIKAEGASEKSLLHPYYADGTDEGIAERVELLLGLNSKADAPVYEKYFTDQMGEEMQDKDYYDFMVWHRGMAVPMARGLNTEEVQRGKKLFSQIGCEYCHRPSWKTGNDDYWKCSVIAGSNGGDLPRFANQTIWPYTDMVQHRLYMENDIRTGWCRTTPLWGRGLSLQETGAQDRLHDCRARNTLEAIMWHGYSKDSDAFFSVQNFYNLKKEDRDAVVKFIEAI